MINKVIGTRIIPNIAKATKATGGKGKPLSTRFMQNETFGKILDVAAENQTVCQSLFALAICVGPRPVTNFIVTKDKQDATYASCHSISSGGVGFIWPLVFATPIAVGLKRIAKNPVKYLNPEIIEKFYPTVGVKETLAEDGKTVIKEILTNEKGQMLRKDGTVLCTSNEPMMAYGERAKEGFEANYPNHYVDKGGVVRSKLVPKTEGGVIKLDKDGNQIGTAVQTKNYMVDKHGIVKLYEKDANGNIKLDANNKKIGQTIPESELTPITEEMEIGAQKEQNVNKFINMVPDIILAPVRASLTIALIPPLLGAFGIKKRDKSAGQTANQGINLVSTSSNTVVTGKMGNVASTFNSFKKGGM